MIAQCGGMLWQLLDGSMLLDWTCLLSTTMLGIYLDGPVISTSTARREEQSQGWTHGRSQVYCPDPGEHIDDWAFGENEDAHRVRSLGKGMPGLQPWCVVL